MSLSIWLALHLAIGFPLGLVAANFGEWIIHRNVLHKRGKRKGSFWNFHWYDHHAQSRKNDMVDPAYETSWLSGGWTSRTKEAAALLVGAVPWVLLLPFIPGFSAAMIYSSWCYYRVHKRAHLDPAWARAHLPWHVDHHLGRDQDKNWCVTRPWADILLGTREKIVGTPADPAQPARMAAAEAPSLPTSP